MFIIIVVMMLPLYCDCVIICNTMKNYALIAYFSLLKNVFKLLTQLAIASDNITVGYALSGCYNKLHR